MKTFILALKHATRELVGGIKDFRAFVLCLMLGVGAITAASSTNININSGLNKNAQEFLGGDIQLRLSYREINESEYEAIKNVGKIGKQISMKSMGKSNNRDSENPQKTSLISLKAVDNAYPLYSSLKLNLNTDVRDSLRLQNNKWGAIIDPALRYRLGISIGDDLKIGDTIFEVRNFISKEPDRTVNFSATGPRVIISIKALKETGLIQKGSLITYIYNLKLNDVSKAKEYAEYLSETLSETEWRIRVPQNAIAGISAFVRSVTTFLTLVGLATLLVGSIGINNASRAYLHKRTENIAIMKCLGASKKQILINYGSQMAVLGLIGTLLGLVIGATTPFLTENFIEELLPINVNTIIHVDLLINAAAYGLICTALSTLIPLLRAGDTKPINLLTRLENKKYNDLPKLYIVAFLILIISSVVFIVISSPTPLITIYFLLGSLCTFILLYLAGKICIKLASEASPLLKGLPTFRLAINNIHRPGNSTISVIVSLGLGVSILIAILLIQKNLSYQIEDELPETLPSMFFIDIQPKDGQSFKANTENHLGVKSVTMAPVVRGRINKINGRAANIENVDKSAQWALRSERGLSFSNVAPAGTVITEGKKWWPSDYQGSNLLSIEEKLANGMGLKIGDTITINILGKDVKATVFNLRRVRWQSGRLNFALIFSSNSISQAPHTYVASLDASPEYEEAIRETINREHPNVTIIAVRESLELVANSLVALTRAISISIGVAIIASVLVLSSAIAANNDKRIYDSVIMKVLGASRKTIFSAYTIEFVTLGLIAAFISLLIGTAGAFLTIFFIMELEWSFHPILAIKTILASVAILLFSGFSGIWYSLSQKPADALRASA